MKRYHYRHSIRRPYYLHPSSPESFLRRSPSRYLFKRFTLFAVLLFGIGSFNFGNVYGSEYYDFGGGGDSFFEDTDLVMDEEGYLTKTVHSETGEGNWEGISGTHVVQPGETLSQIANAYGLKPSTIIWENDLVNSNFLQIGQKLTILPEDGITLKIKKGDNIDSIAEKYKIASTSINEANTLEAGVIREGDILFLPGAKKIYEKPKYIASNPSVADERPRASSQNVGTIAKVNVVSTSGKKLVFPTSGQITQWYHSGHYAYDISDTSQPPIWAAASGVVLKAQCGWNGGYGCVILVDHGNDLETLYAHLDDIYVEVGQAVEQGQVIGKQGNTGRVYGRTGIHLHFEVRENGVKLNPGNYF